MRIAAKVARIGAKVVLIALAAVALIVGVAWSFLQTRRGGELVRRLALPRVNAAIAGEIRLGRFAFGGDRLTFDDVVVTDPEGRPALRVARIDISFSPLALLRRHVDVKRIDVRRPELALIQEPRGLNLARALAPRRSAAANGATSEPEAAPGRGGLAVDVRALRVNDGVIDYRAPADGDGDSGHVNITELAVRGAARFAAGRLEADARISVHGGRADLRGGYDLVDRRGQGEAHASIRGVAIAVDARIDGDAVGGHASVDATDLAAAARGLAHDFDLPRLAMAGEGRLDVTLGGTTAAPSLRVSARFAEIEFADTRARNLALTAWVPDVGVPDALDLDVNAAALSIGSQHLRAPTVTVHAAGRDISARAAVAAPYPLRIDLAATRQRGRTMVISALTLRYPEATWTLRRPARLSLADPIALSGFELGADAQRVIADVKLGGGAPRAHVAISRFDLARLPAALVPPSLGLAGTLDGDVDAVLADPPRVIARAKLSGGRVHGHRDLSFALDGRLERGRAKGALQARALGVGAHARFDLPADWPPRNPRAPVDLQIDVEDADLAAVAAAVAETGGGPAPRLGGHARVSIRLDGRVGTPRLHAEVAGRDLIVDSHRIGDLQLAVNGEGDGKIAAQLTSEAPARTRIDVETPLSLRAVLRRPPTAASLARLPLTIKGTVDRLPLAMLARAAGYQERVGGSLSANLEITGTASDPEGTIAVDVAGATTGRFPATDARLELDLRDQAVEARARVVRRSQALLSLEARVGGAPAALLHPARLATAPVRVRAVFGPYLVQRLGLPPVTEREPPRELHGRIHADLAVDGTLGAPRALFHLQASDIHLDKALVGYAQIEATYADRQAKVDAQLASHNGGTLRTVAAMTANLGYPAVTHGLDVRRAPIDVRLDAKQFDLQGLSGITKDVRTVAGLLTASLSVRGSAADPRVNGRLEWSDGVVAITGIGEYKKIHLLVHGDADQVTLDELSSASGSGSARVTGSASHKPGGGYDVAATTKLERFPIYVQGQPMAIISLDSHLNGRAGASGAKLNLEVDDARIELTDAKRKDLQSLDAPKDVVLMNGDQPLNAAQAARLHALLATEPAPTGPSKRPPSLRLKVNAPRQLWVSGKDANLELGLSPDFRVSVGQRTQVYGQVTVHRGRVDIFGRRFDIKADSTLTFGGAPDRPALDVTAEHRNDTEKLTVVLTAKGPLDKLDVSVSAPARPDLTESQLYTLIITGHLQFGGSGATGASPSAQAASLVGGLLASKLQSTVAKRLPLDVFTIDVGGEGMMGTKLEAGRYVADRLYVGYIGRVGTDPTRYQNRNAVHLEYQITSRWEIEGEYGDLGTGTADLIWKKSY